jgi:hypothetical protein
MKEEISPQQMRIRLERVFGPLTAVKSKNRTYIQAPGFSVCGRNHLFLSGAGDDTVAALKNLFRTISNAARNCDSGGHPSETSHVYNGNRNEIFSDPVQGLIVADRQYDERLGF